MKLDDPLRWLLSEGSCLVKVADSFEVVASIKAVDSVYLLI